MQIDTPGNTLRILAMDEAKTAKISNILACNSAKNPFLRLEKNQYIRKKSGLIRKN